MQQLTVATEGQAVADIGRVGPKCVENLGFWYCITHRKGFQNQLMKDIHIHQGRHTLAWMCRHHGIEVP